VTDTVTDDGRGRNTALGSRDRPDFELTDEELRAAGSVKWTYCPPDVLPAWVAEMDVRPCPPVLDAVRAAVERGTFGYPAMDRDSGLPEATAAFLGRRFGWQVEPGSVLGCGDVMAGVRLTLETFCADAPVVVPTPSYPPFLEAVPLTGRRVVEVPCLAGSAPTLDLVRIDAALAAGARTVLLSQPHNPLGRAFTAAELAALRDVVVRHGARVISDEIHAPLVLPGAEHTPYATLAGTADHVTTVVAASKAWNLPGLKCAQLIAGNPSDLATLTALPHVANHGMSPLGVVASIAAYTHGEAWLDGLLAHLIEQRELFGALLAEHLPAAGWTSMEATYLAWVDAHGYRSDVSSADPSATALARGRVFVNPGRSFGVGYDDFVRVNLATSAARLTSVVERLAIGWDADRSVSDRSAGAAG
jgi:cystathionine beta-lyase